VDLSAIAFRVALAVLSAAAVLPAQVPKDARAASEAALAKQPSAASAKEDSLALQRASLEKQTGQSVPDGFFVLSAPAPLGAAALLKTAALLGAGTALGASAPRAGADCEPLAAPEVDALVKGAAKREGLDEALLRDVMRQESAFRPCAVSPNGAVGLMQLMPATASQLGAQNPSDNAANVAAGARLLKKLLTRYRGDRSLTLAAYNANPTEVDAAAGVPRVPETQDDPKQSLSRQPPKQ